jgi:FG-GAP-like repeat/Reeler domain/FG-GAP repeat
MTVKKLKLFVLLSFAALGSLILLSGKSFVEKTHASISGPPAARTSAPGELNCTDCHNAATGAGQFMITAPTTYTPGQTYSIQVRHTTSDTTRKRWGFEMTSLGTGGMAGSFTNVNATTQLKSSASNGRTYIEHTTAGNYQNQTGGAVWSFNWTAPATNVGAVTFYAAGIQANNDGSESGDQTYLKTAIIQPAVTVAATHVVSDFDGDGRTDPAIVRNENNSAVWYAKTTAGVSIQQFGLATDKFVPADYDGDGKTDAAVFRNGNWWTFKTATNTVSLDQFGASGDTPIVGDYDADGKADLCIYRQGNWWLKKTSDNSTSVQQWGNATDKPLSGDFDGDGKADLAIYRPNLSEWWISRSSNGTFISLQFGVTGDIPVPADYDGDRSTNIAVFRPSLGVWYTSTDVNNNYYGAIPWGISTDVPVSGDYDGDGKTDVAVYRNGTWYIRSSSNTALSVQYFGLSSDTAVPYLYIQ